MTQDETRPDALFKKTQDWIAYIEAEVAAVCRNNGWTHRIRRKWTVREKPVSSSPIDDYEWKLIPAHDPDRPPAAQVEDFEGIYFVLSFDSGNGKFLLQHDTNHCGAWGPHFLTTTYTEIRLGPESLHAYGWAEKEQQVDTSARTLYSDRLPPEGWLQRFLLDLTARFQPNHFSIT